MRYGLPIEHDTESQINGNVWRQQDGEAICNRDVIPSSVLVKYTEQAKPNNRDENNYFKYFQSTLADYIKSFGDSILSEHKRYLNIASERYHSKKDLVDFNVNAVRLEVEKKLKVQSDEVDKIVKEEEKRRLQELEARKKAEEEAKRRQKQEENIRKEKEERDRIAAHEAKEKAAEKKREQESWRLEEIKKQERENKGFTSFKAVEEQFFRYRKEITNIKRDIVEEIDKDKELKKKMGTLKRKTNPKFGQLSNSFQQLQIVTRAIMEIVEEAKTYGSIGYRWLLNFIAKAIVHQAEAEVTVKPTSALPLARLAYSLLRCYPEFELFLSARFIKKCPLIIGYSCSVESEQGRERMGWKRFDNNWEDEVKYEERVAGICSVWSVMTRLEDQTIDLYRISSAWVFLARLLNTDKRFLSNVHFACASNWWEACAQQFLRLYGFQGQKLLKLLCVDWPSSVSDKKWASAVRLSILGESWLTNNKVESLKEMEY